MTVLMGHPYDDQYCSNASKRRPLSLDLSGNTVANTPSGTILV
jgi:hypothetical protein